MKETIEQFLARGGNVTQCEPGHNLEQMGWEMKEKYRQMRNHISAKAKTGKGAKSRWHNPTMDNAVWHSR